MSSHESTRRTRSASARAVVRGSARAARRARPPRRALAHDRRYPLHELRPATVPASRRIVASMAPRSLSAPSRTHYPSTEQRWRERVVAWQRSGLTADVIVADKPYSASTLHWWSSRLRRAATPTFVELRLRIPGQAPQRRRGSARRGRRRGSRSLERAEQLPREGMVTPLHGLHEQRLQAVAGFCPTICPMEGHGWLKWWRREGICSSGTGIRNSRWSQRKDAMARGRRRSRWRCRASRRRPRLEGCRSVRPRGRPGDTARC